MQQQTMSKNARDMELSQTSNKTKMLNAMVLRAWRERWTESQWGINIKTILPRGVSGDVYNLANCLLQQALVGSTANMLVLNLLKHSLCSQLVSHAAVLQHIATYDCFNRRACLSTLLQFLNSLMDGVTCRNKQEEQLLPKALLHLVKWLLLAFPTVMQADDIKLMEKYCRVVRSFVKDSFLVSLLYVARQEDAELYESIRKQHAIVDEMLDQMDNLEGNPLTQHLQEQLKALATISLSHLKIVPQLANTTETDVESVTYIIQPLLAVDVLINPTKETVFFVHEMQTIQRLKNFSNERLFYEIIRAGLISLSNMAETSHDTMWGAFTFFKIPHILRSLYVLSRNEDEELPSDHIPEVVKAFEMLMEDNLLLDSMDSKCACNIIEYILNDWTKHQLVTEAQCKNFASQREKSSSMLQKRDAKNAQNPSIINFIIRAEVPLNGILKTLGTDYNKVQEALLGVLCQVLVGNSFDLILSVATVEGRLRSFISRLIQCNENSMQVAGETGKQQAIRSTLFDVSFLMLTFITQTYGANILLSANNYNGNSFFERWVRECMVERNKPKNPANIVDLCEEEKVDELLLTLSKSDAQTKNTLTWQDICMTLPAVLHHVLIAWQHEALTSADVKNILDNIKRRLFCYSVCATSYLCAYMYSVRQQEFLKPLNMIQQFLTPSTNEDLGPQDNVKERMALTFQIIRKMQHDVHPSGTYKPRSIALTQSLVSTTPLIDHFKEVWKNVSESGYISVRSAQMLESLLQAGGPVWLARHLVEQIIHCKYVRDMTKTMDIVFSTMHLDIMLCTSSLLEDVIPLLVQNRQGEDVNEPQLLVLANLCVYCIISCVEIQNAETAYGYVRNGVYYESRALADKRSKTNSALMLAESAKKRPRATDTDTDNFARSALTKTRKIGINEEQSSSDFITECLGTVSANTTADHLNKTAQLEQRPSKSEEASLWNLHTEQCYSTEEEDSTNSTGLVEAIASVSGFLSVEASNKSLEDMLLAESTIDRFNDAVDSSDCNSEISSTKDACSELVSMLEAVAEYEVKSVESAVAALSGACVLDNDKEVVDIKDEFMKLKSEPDALAETENSKSGLLDMKKGIILDNVDIFMNSNKMETPIKTKDENDGIENELIKIKQERDNDNENINNINNNNNNNDSSNHDLINNLNDLNNDDNDNNDDQHNDDLPIMNDDNSNHHNNNENENELATEKSSSSSSSNANENNNNNDGSSQKLNNDNENSTNKLNDLMNDEQKSHNNDNDKSLEIVDKSNHKEESNDKKDEHNNDKEQAEKTENMNEAHNNDNEMNSTNNEKTDSKMLMKNDENNVNNLNENNDNNNKISEYDKEQIKKNDTEQNNEHNNEISSIDKDLEQNKEREVKENDNNNITKDNNDNVATTTATATTTVDKLAEPVKDNDNASANANANDLILEAANSITHAISVDSGLGENVESIFGHMADLVDGASASRVKESGGGSKEETTALLEANNVELSSVTTALGFDDLDTDTLSKSKSTKSNLDGEQLDNLFNDATTLSLTADTQDGANFANSEVLDANTEVSKLLGALENSKSASDETSISDLLGKEALTHSGIEDISEDAVDGMLGAVMDVSADFPVGIKTANKTDNSSDSKKLEASEHKSLDAMENCAALFSTETSVSAELNALDSTTALVSDELNKLPLLSASLDAKLTASTENDALAQAFANTEGFNLDDEATFSGRLAALASLDVDETVSFNNAELSGSETTETNANLSTTTTTTTATVKEGTSTSTSTSTSQLSSNVATNASSSSEQSVLGSSRITVRNGMGDGSRLKAKRLGKYSYPLRDPLASSVHTLFKAFQHFVNTEDLSPKVYFVHQFITLLVEHGGERVRPVLNLLPPTIMPAMLKILLNKEISCGLIARLYDLDTFQGRQSAVSDLCLWQNIKLKQENKQM